MIPLRLLVLEKKNHERKEKKKNNIICKNHQACKLPLQQRNS
jgi:hypothetical protein